MWKNDKLNIFHIDMNYVCLKMEFLRKWLKRIADMGYNTVLWELENKVKWETCPECVWPEAMSKDEFRELLAYSKSLGLESIPLLQTIGHAEYVLSHDKYISFREIPERCDCYCTSNSDTRDFLLKWIEEYLELFGDIRYFHLGGDEAYVFGTCAKCADFVKTHSKNQLYSEHINALAAPILEKKIRPGIWNDMIMHYPESVDLISKDFVIWDWNYWDTDATPDTVVVRGHGYLKRDAIDNKLLELLPELLDNENNLQAFYSVRTLKKLGFDIILCSASSSAGDNFYCPAPIHVGNIVGAASTVIKENLLGNCVTSWALRMNDYITQIPSIGLAERAMRNPEKKSEALYFKYCEELFGTAPDKFIKAAYILGISMPFAQAQSTGVQWDGLKSSLPAPKNYIFQYMEKLKQKDPDMLKDFAVKINKAVNEIPKGIKLLSEFFQEAECGFDIIEYWMTGAKLFLDRALIAQKIMKNEKPLEILQLLKDEKNEYRTFLARRETSASADKNAGLVFNVIIDFFNP